MKSNWKQQTQRPARTTFWIIHDAIVSNQHSTLEEEKNEAKLIHISLGTFASFRIMCLCFISSDHGSPTHSTSNANANQANELSSIRNIYLIHLKCKTILLNVLKKKMLSFFSLPLQYASFKTDECSRNNFIVYRFVLNRVL